MINLLFPKLCYVCQKEGEYICTNCFRKLIVVDPVNRCHVCNKESRIGFVHLECKELTYLDGVLNLSIYDGLIKKLIYDLKYNYYFGVAETLGKLMADYLQFYSFKKSNTVLSYVPTSKQKLKIRGFNQAQVLVNQIAKNSDFAINPLLLKVYNTGAQAKLGKQGRAENLNSAFKILDKIKLSKDYKNIVIIDDVFTTGATLNQCAKIIKNSYPTVNVYGFVIAKARN